MRPIYRALQKLTPPRNTPPPQVPASIHSSPSSRLMNGVLFSVGFLDSQLSSHCLLYASSNWLLIPCSDCEGLHGGSTFATPDVKTWRRKKAVEFQAMLSVFFVNQRRHLQKWNHTITVSLLPFHLEGLTVWLLSYSLRSGGSSIVLYIHWSADANSLMWVNHEAKLGKWPASSLRHVFPWCGPSVWAGEGLPACKSRTVINLIIRAVSSACPVTHWSFLSLKGWKEQIRSCCLITYINKPKRGMNGQCRHKTYCQSALSWTRRLAAMWYLYYVISCFILKLCPHLSCVAFHFLLLCDFSTLSTSSNTMCASTQYSIAYL